MVVQTVSDIEQLARSELECDTMLAALQSRRRAGGAS